jgi:putative NADH-flavin reductase
MVILLFGSTGRVGSSVLNKILGLGHDAMLFVRNKKKILVQNDRIKIIEGDVLDQDAFDKLKDLNFDAIINAIGADPLKPSSLYTDTTRLILNVLKLKPQVHYIGITGIAQMEKTFFGKIVIGILKLTPVKNAILDHQNAFNLVKDSGSQWTLIGCPYIVDGDEKGNYHTDSKFRGGFKTIHPGDVSGALVRELSQSNFQKIIGIWY